MALHETPTAKTARIKAELAHIKAQGPRLDYLADAKVRELAQHYAESDPYKVIERFEQ